MERKYIVLSLSTVRALEENVASAMKDGYTPLGGVSVTSVQKVDKTTFTYSQALIKTS
jgi:hypothetical protein